MRTALHAFLSAAMILAFTASTPSLSRAQQPEGLEQTYARLCGSGQKTEACAALRQALTQKLTGQTEISPPGGESGDRASLAAASQTNQAKPAGFVAGEVIDATGDASSTSPWADRLGAQYQAPDIKSARAYSDGNSLTLEVRVVAGTFDAMRTTVHFFLNLDGERATGIDQLGVEGTDGMITVRGSDARAVYLAVSPSGGGYLAGQHVGQSQQLPDGYTIVIPLSALTPTPSAGMKWQVATAIKLDERTNTRELDTGAPASSGQVTSTPTVPPVWGFWAQLAGSSWLNKEGDLYSYEWQELGKVLGAEVITADATRNNTFVLSPDGASLILRTATESSPMQRLADGTFAQLTSSSGRFRYALEGTELTVTEEELDGGNWGAVGCRLNFPVPGACMLVDPQVRRRLEAEEVAGIKNALAQQRQDLQRVAEAPPAKPKGRGGLLRGAIGAGLGVAAARVGGMDAEQTVGMAAKGVALMNPESQAAQVIGASGDAVLQSSGLGTAGAGAASAGSKASYPTKPNMLAGQAACSMMNESNYRQVAVSGGNDVQLKTMCGQAHEYYSMYKRAIAQGYAEADANRTFAAHEQSARVAIEYYRNNR